MDPRTHGRANGYRSGARYSLSFPRFRVREEPLVLRGSWFFPRSRHTARKAVWSIREREMTYNIIDARMYTIIDQFNEDGSLAAVIYVHRSEYRSWEA